MINYTITKDDVEIIEKLIKLRNKGFYANGAEVTEIYNRVLHKSVPSTSCGSCIRQRITELEGALKHFKSKMANEAILSHSESVEEVKPTTTPQEENKEVVEEKKRPGRPPKKS